jgi:hypothetical protein
MQNYSATFTADSESRKEKKGKIKRREERSRDVKGSTIQRHTTVKWRQVSAKL